MPETSGHRSDVVVNRKLPNAGLSLVADTDMLNEIRVSRRLTCQRTLFIRRAYVKVHVFRISRSRTKIGVG